MSSTEGRGLRKEVSSKNMTKSEGKVGRNLLIFVHKSNIPQVGEW